MTGRYAKGRHALAECMRSGQKMRYRDLVEDGHIPGLLVHPDWWEPKHPQETPPDMTDPVALYRPAPEISIPAGNGDPENLDGGTAPTTPSGAVVNTLSLDATAGNRFVVLNQAQRYTIGHWVFIELDGGGTYFVSRIATDTTTPTFVLHFTSAFSGAATAGNNIYIEAAS